MSIHKIGSDLIRPFGPKRTSAAESTGADSSEDAQRAPKADRVELSREGLELAAQIASEADGLSPAREAQIRERLESGFYNDPEIVDQVAQNLFASGDLRA